MDASHDAMSDDDDGSPAQARAPHIPAWCSTHPRRRVRHVTACLHPPAHPRRDHVVSPVRPYTTNNNPYERAPSRGHTLVAGHLLPRVRALPLGARMLVRRDRVLHPTRGIHDVITPSRREVA